MVEIFLDAKLRNSDVLCTHNYVIVYFPIVRLSRRSVYLKRQVL